jgi:inosine/xanthosine triphosphate pyrophosphatase family protein
LLNFPYYLWQYNNNNNNNNNNSKIKKEVQKVLNYKHFITEIQCMWTVKEKVIPVIVGVTGTISKSDTGNSGGDWNHFKKLYR